MNHKTAMKEWVSRKTYPQKNSLLDAESKQRLSEEVPKLQAQMEKTKGDGS
jgi:hypothetical protein